VSSASTLDIHLIGPLRIFRNGEKVALPQSKKTRALLGYLVATERPHRRERLCSMFWDVTDDPRAALRWSLSRLRPLVDGEGASRILAEDDSIAFRAAGANVDLYAMRALVGKGLESASTEDLLRLANEAPGDLLEGVALPDFDEFQAWLVAEREEARQLQCRILETLLDRLTGDPEKAIPHARHEVHLKPTDARARSRLLRLLIATGRDREAEQQVQTGLQALSAAGIDDRMLREAWSKTERTVSAPISKVELHQQVRFCKSKDGTRIAYATCGSGPMLIKAANWLSHLEYDWESPVWRHCNRAFAAEHTYVRYDVRGSGLSDWDVSEFSFDRFVEDLEAVADAVGTERFSLLGISQGGAVCIEYAVRHPERVDALILLGAYALGWEKRASEKGLERYRAMMTLIRTGWGADNPAFRQMFTSLFLPGGTLEQVRWFNELQRISTTPENAARIREATGLVDVRRRLAEVRVPTLVVHVKDDAVVPHRYGVELASEIPRARFVSVDGVNHLVLETDPGWPRFLEEKRRFLSELGVGAT
jgi:pimeloyl-ACP methyl ester carboxylesterase